MRDSAGSSGGHLPIPPLIDAFRHARNRTGATKISLSSKFGRRKVIHRTVLAAPVPNAPARQLARGSTPGRTVEPPIGICATDKRGHSGLIVGHERFSNAKQLDALGFAIAAA
jgi:hypothetical protein